MIWKPLKDQDKMSFKYNENKLEGIKVFVNQLPTWNAKHKGYTLKFDERVSMPSVKNFKIIQEDLGDYIYL